MVQILKKFGAVTLAGAVAVSLLIGAGTGYIRWDQINSVFRHGTGAYGQASDGTGTSGHYVKFDSNGNVTDGGTGSGVTLQTNGVNNGSQSTLNLVAGTNVTLTDGGSGNVTIASAAGGSGGWPSNLWTAPVPANFSWVNQGSVTLDTILGIGLSAPYAAGDSLHSQLTPIINASAFTVTEAFIYTPPGQTSSANCNGGLILYNGSKLYEWQINYQGVNGAGSNIQLTSWSGPTVFASNNFAGAPFLPYSTTTWLRVSLSSGTMTFSASQDGIQFNALYSTGSPYVTAVSHAGFGISNGYVSGQKFNIRMASFVQTTP